MSILWPEGPIFVGCGGVNNAYKLEGVRTKPSKKNPKGVERHGLYECRSKECRKQFTVRQGTRFESTKPDVRTQSPKFKDLARELEAPLGEESFDQIFAGTRGTFAPTKEAAFQAKREGKAG